MQNMKTTRRTTGTNCAIIVTMVALCVVLGVHSAEPSSDCDAFHWGGNCEHQCSCYKYGGECDSGRNGTGSCTACFPNFFGPTCSTRCKCKLGTCDSRPDVDAGHCTKCNSEGITGVDCNRCKKGYFGLVCSPCPPCLHGGECNDGFVNNGTCSCPPEWTGSLCEVSTLTTAAPPTTSPTPPPTTFRPSSPANATPSPTPHTTAPQVVRGIYIVLKTTFNGKDNSNTTELASVFGSWLDVPPQVLHLWNPRIDIPDAIAFVVFVDGNYTLEETQAHYENFAKLVESGHGLAYRGVLQSHFIFDSSEIIEPTPSPPTAPPVVILPPDTGLGQGHGNDDGIIGGKSDNEMVMWQVAMISIAAILCFMVLLFGAWKLYVRLYVWRAEKKKAMSLKAVRTANDGEDDDDDECTGLRDGDDVKTDKGFDGLPDTLDTAEEDIVDVVAAKEARPAVRSAKKKASELSSRSVSFSLPREAAPAATTHQKGNDTAVDIELQPLPRPHIDEPKVPQTNSIAPPPPAEEDSPNNEQRLIAEKLKSRLDSMPPLPQPPTAPDEGAPPSTTATALPRKSKVSKRKGTAAQFAVSKRTNSSLEDPVTPPPSIAAPPSTVVGTSTRTNDDATKQAEMDNMDDDLLPPPTADQLDKRLKELGLDDDGLFD